MPLRPLEGFTIGITADRRWLEQAELLERRGAQIMHGPTISTRYLGGDEALRHATDALIASPPDYLVATTGIGIRAWFEAAQAWGLADALLEALRTSRVVARGAKAAAAVQVAGLHAWATPETERLDDVVNLLVAESLSGCTVAFQHYGEREVDAVNQMAAAGATIIDVPVYRYGPPTDGTKAHALIDAICERHVDAVTFTSAPAVARLLAIAHERGRGAELLGAINQQGVVAACVGPVCAEAAARAGIDRPVAPSRGRLGLLVRALSDALQARRHELRYEQVSVVVQGRAVEIDGASVVLTPTERSVLDLLLRRPGAVVPKSTLVRSAGTAPTSARALEVTVGRLRRRLGVAGGAVQTVRGRGYLLDLVRA